MLFGIEFPETRLCLLPFHMISLIEMIEKLLPDALRFFLYRIVVFFFVFNIGYNSSLCWYVGLFFLIIKHSLNIYALFSLVLSREALVVIQVFLSFLF